MVCAGFTPHFAGSVSISGVLVVLLPFSPYVSQNERRCHPERSARNARVAKDLLWARRRCLGKADPSLALRARSG